MEYTTFTKEDVEKLEKTLKRDKKNVWSQVDDKIKKSIFEYSERYKDFLSIAKTEREAVSIIRDIAIKNNFSPIDDAKKSQKKLFWSFKDKTAALINLGKKPLSDGFRLVASHIDAPRIDLKQNPLYEELDMAYLKTHYYGGIKKYHWLSRPLAIHGPVLKNDGSTVNIIIGEDENDPVFTINDLLPHLAGKVQGDKKLPDAFPAEKLNILIGGIPLISDDSGKNGIKEAVKLNILKLLNDKYGIIEEDLVSAELEVIPAGKARDVGFDRAFVGGYAHDDRSCAFASLKAILDAQNPEIPCIAVFFDKEEIGSDGNTGANSKILEILLYDLLNHAKERINPETLTRIFSLSKAISADVTAGIDPDYQEVHEKRNDALIGYGICLTKYTGSRGKYSASDAHAEYMNWIRRIWNNNNVIWQAGELGKVDEGGGGTVAKYLAYHGMDIVDAGTPLLAMHSPFEIAHKSDLFMTYLAYNAFFKEA
jgi:aspartyl aminopeptidase